MISDYYTKTAVILSQSTSTGWGSEPSWSGATVTCAMNPVTGHESFVGGRETAYASWKLYCSATESITEENRVVYSGDTYDVVFVKDTLGRGHHKMVMLRDVARG